MKAVGYAVLLVALLVGGTVLANVISKKSEQECASQCPDKPDAIQTKVELGPLRRRLCNCGEVKK